MHRETVLLSSVFMMKVTPSVFKALVISLILAAVVYGGYLLFRGADIMAPSLFRPVSGTRLIMSMDGFRFSQSENGDVSWRMSAKSADLYENKEAQLKDIEIVFKSPDNKEATLLGEQGTMDTSNGNASIRRGAREVRIITSNGYLLTTDSLFWKAGEQLVWTTDPFKLLGKEIYLEGTGLSANVNMSTIAVRDHVKAVLQE
jgi:LPS export ABC transporter protein LptC